MVLDYVIPLACAAAAVTAVVPGLSVYIGFRVYWNM